jgi:hypothetical protein
VAKLSGTTYSYVKLMRDQLRLSTYNGMEEWFAILVVQVSIFGIDD